MSTDPMPQPQPVAGDLTRAAIFVVLTLHPGDAAVQTLRGLLGDLPGLIRSTAFRAPAAGLTCIVGLGADAWSRLSPGAAPRHLRPFAAIEGVHTAPATPGDILLHVRAAHLDHCFELVTNVMARLAGVVTVEDETHGFKFFDNRDLLGFVDGTENPDGAARIAAVLIGQDDPAFAGGSYVITQKYLHDMPRWNAMSVAAQEDVIGRHKLNDVEQLPAAKKPFAHNVLTNITDEDGRQLQILRDNMPFGSAARGEFGTYFIGYACDPGRTERMLRNMFIGDPPGTYDHILDVSRPVTGSLFFVPSQDLLTRITGGS